MSANARASTSGDAQDASATASTLNYALGSRHMKSWMTGAVNGVPPTPSSLTPDPASPVRRNRGRPRKYPLSDAVDHQHATETALLEGSSTTAPSAERLPSSLTPNPVSPVRRKRGRPRKYPLPDAVDHQHATETAPLESGLTTAPSAERLTPSNSTSPQLANIVTDYLRSRSHGFVDVIAFPSPTPSEEDAHYRGSQNQQIGTEPPVDIDGLDFASFQSLSASAAVPATAARSPTRQGLPPPKRPAEEGSPSVEKRARTDTVSFAVVSPSDVPTFPEFSGRPSAPHAQQRSPSPGPAPSRSPSLGQVTNTQMASPQLMQMTQDPGSRSNSSPVQDLVHNAPAHQTYVSPQLNAQPFGVQPGTQQFAYPASIVPSHLRASYHDDWYTINTCVRGLRSFGAAYPAAIQNRRNRKDEIRLHVLVEAVRAHDWAYLTLHQYYCMMTFAPHALPLTLQHNGNLALAYSLMQEVLDVNSQLSLPALAFFCGFPFTINHLASTWPTRYQYAEREFAAFVSHSANIGALRQASERRRVPPTSREFANCAIKSMTFQRLLFRSIVRVLWGNYPDIPEKGYFEDQALQAFRAQALFEQQIATDGLGGRDQAHLELLGWKNRFIQITNSFEVCLQRQGYLPTDPALPHLSQYQQQQQQPQPRAQNAPSSADIAMSRRQQSPPPSMNHRTASQTHAPSRSRQDSTAWLPRPGVTQPQQRVPVPSRFGLHQAHLRSPVLQVTNPTLPTYYFWQGFVRKPQRLKNANTAIEKLDFTLSAKEMDIIATTMPTALGDAGSRLIDETHKLIRLRCVKWSADLAPEDEDWAVAVNSWIPHSYFTLNDVPLQLRKKLHNGRDLPVDLTGLVRQGENVLEVSVTSNSADTTHRNYLVAVEFLGIMTKASIKRRCNKKIIAAEVIVSNITRKLMPSATDDDDIILMESTLTINLCDPFSASKICDTPVRGTACVHNECFDLDTFLETRPRKGDVTAADQWRCPICKADARPTALVVDGFLVDVRKELEQKGLLDTRAIVVSQDGSWKPKPEE